MRFLWNYVPLMGIAWFMAVLWPRANRWGAIASFFAALTAAGLANFVFDWKGDAGLPYTITLYLSAGVGAGILVSLLTPREDPQRTESFFLLLKTPVGQEQVLRDAGFRESPGSDTFDLPERSGRSFEVSEEELSSSAGGVATATIVAPKTAINADLKKAIQAARRQSLTGFVVLIGVVVAMLVGIMLLAKWLAP
jgi:Na+/proline symporter